MLKELLRLRLVVIATPIAITITSLMDFNDLLQFSALPLFAISLSFYFITYPSRVELGLTIGKLRDYGVALLYPIVIALFTIFIGLIFTSNAIRIVDSGKIFIGLIAGILIGPILVFLTEEGFFRGWLWSSLKRNGMSDKGTMIFSTIAFTLWHVSAVTSDTFYGLPIHQVPIYLINAFLMSLVWSQLRLVSNSVLVPSFCHAIWNAIVYTFFGFGEKIGALGMDRMDVLGPEVGYLGVLLNALFLFAMTRFYSIKVRYPSND